MTLIKSLGVAWPGLGCPGLPEFVGKKGVTSPGPAWPGLSSTSQSPHPINLWI